MKKEENIDHGRLGRISAIVLAAGQGKRMESRTPKQFMLLDGKPLVYYALKAFEESEVEDVVLVTGEEEVDYCQNQIVELFGFSKVKMVVTGGKERYHSVYEGLKALERLERKKAPFCCDKMQPVQPEIVLIHDGARPFLTEQILHSCINEARTYGACAAAMPVKDTIKVIDKEGFAAGTPERSSLWMVQTPQAFAFDLIKTAYDRMFSDIRYQQGVTDDAMVVETMTETKVKLTPGDYRNIKITTPEDMILAEALLHSGW